MSTLEEEIGTTIEFKGPSDCDWVEIGAPRVLMRNGDASPEELRDILGLFAELAENFVAPFDSIEGLLKGAQDTEGFTVRTIANSRDGSRYIAYLHGFGGNTDGFIVREKDRSVIAQVMDTQILPPEDS